MGVNASGSAASAVSYGAHNRTGSERDRTVNGDLANIVPKGAVFQGPTGDEDVATFTLDGKRFTQRVLPPTAAGK
ncbi:MAG: hypothetical protein HC848_07170 [Limnobacter sp.]|nr:hypothetical protein [Limnobacter sp.]